MCLEKRITTIGNSYWGSNGAYQTEYDELYPKLVPSHGQASTLHGELIRAISRLNYEFCNNGNCNALDFTTDTCGECYGSGFEEVYIGRDDDGEEMYEEQDCSACDGNCEVARSVEITEMYDGFIQLIKMYVPNSNADKLEAFLKDEDKGYSNYSFENDEMKIYNDVFDSVMYFVLTTENRLL